MFPGKSIKPSRRLLVAAVSVAVVAGGGALLWRKVIRDHVYPKRFGTVKEGVIYRSGQIEERLIGTTLVKYDVETVIDLTKPDDDSPEQEAELEAIEELGIEGLRFPMPGTGCGTAEAYVDALAALRSTELAGKTALVHCSAGSNRTGGVIACYRVLFEGLSTADALLDMQTYDWDPTGSFTLPKHLNTIMPELVEGLHRRGLLAEIPDPLPRFPESREE